MRLDCLRCGWSWTPKVPLPKKCPSCMGRWSSPYVTSTYGGDEHMPIGRRFGGAQRGQDGEGEGGLQ